MESRDGWPSIAERLAQVGRQRTVFPALLLSSLLFGRYQCLDSFIKLVEPLEDLLRDEVGLVVT